MNGKRSLLDAMRDQRATYDTQGRLIAAPPPALRPGRTSIKFETVDPDAHQRAIDAERQQLARLRQIDQSHDTLTRRDSAQEDAAVRQRKPYTRTQRASAEPKQPASSNKTRPGSNTPAPAPRDPYAHLHADARAVWQFAADYLDQHGHAPSTSEISAATGINYGEASHRLYQLANNAIIREKGSAAFELLIRPPAKPTATIRGGGSLDETSSAVLAFVRRYIAEQGYPPGLREIGEGCYLSTAGVTRHLNQLEAHGHIERDKGKGRGIRLVTQAAG